MAPKRWISTAFLAATVAGASYPSARAQLPPPAPATAPSDTPVEPQTLVNRDIAELSSQLNGPVAPPGNLDPSVVQQQREEAARRLLSRNTAKTNRILLDVLQRPTALREAKIAVARAVADGLQPEPNFAEALLPLLGGERTLNDAVARALGRYDDNPAVRDKLLAFAQNNAQPAALRIAAIRALGGFASREVADALVALAGDARQGAAVQNAAMDTLIELTGQVANGHEPARWKAWQSSNAGKNDSTWRLDILAARSSRAQREDRAQGEMIGELTRILDEQYQRDDAKAKFGIVMSELNSPDARVRGLGVEKVITEQRNANPFPPAAPKRLQEMIGDSDPGVRLLAAQAIQSLNQTDALDAILTQLPQETNVDVKVAQVDALKNMKRLRAVPALRQLLHDPSILVASAAVKAIEALGPALMAQNPALTRQIAQELWQVGLRRANEPGGSSLQAATIEAAGTLHDRDLAKDLLGLLSLNNSERIRSAALRALASLGDRATSFQIAQWLANEPSTAVRANAVAALGSTSTFEFAADTLYRYMSPNIEPDASVREQAWLQFQSLLPSATNTEVLSRWSDEFKNDPARRLQVLLTLNKKLQRDMQWEPLAFSRQNTGETYMDPRIAEPAKAAIQFEEALNYWQEKRTPTPVTAQLVQQLLQALLAAKDYDKATAFGSRQIVRDPTQQTTIGPYLRDAVNRLHDDGVRDNDPQKLKDGVRLSDAILKMQPPLAERFQNDVRQFEQEMQDRLKRIQK